jgi:hypothetical protein
MSVIGSSGKAEQYAATKPGYVAGRTAGYAGTAERKAAQAIANARAATAGPYVS